MPIGPNQQRRTWFLTLNFGEKQKHLLEKQNLEAIEEFFLTDSKFSAVLGQLEEAKKTRTPHYQIAVDTTKVMRSDTLANYIQRHTGGRPWIDERRGNTNYTIKTEGRLRPPIRRRVLKSIKTIDNGTVMRDIVQLLIHGSNEWDIFNRHPMAYFQWGPKIRDFLKARERLENQDGVLREEEE